MSVNDVKLRFVTESVREPDHIQDARTHALELGARPIGVEVGSQSAVLAAASDALNIVEVGTGAGVSGLWLLYGAPRATLTTIDNDAEHLLAARRAFTQANVPAAKVRLITGRALDVLPRMNEAAYDIVFIDADEETLLEYVEHGLRLVRPGGVVLIPGVLASGAADPVRRDATAVAFRGLIQELNESKDVLATISPAGEGLLQITTRLPQ